MLVADGFDDAIIGLTTKEIVVYNVATIIEILIERDGMTEDEAFEYFEFNIDGSYMGDQTPIFIYLDED
jgi:hypothetical protein